MENLKQKARSRRIYSNAGVADEGIVTGRGRIPPVEIPETKVTVPPTSVAAATLRSRTTTVTVATTPAAKTSTTVTSAVKMSSTTASRRTTTVTRTTSSVAGNTTQVNLLSATSSSCPNNTGAIGIFEMWSDPYLLCADPPADLTFVAADPTEVCGNPSNKMTCMSLSCNTNTIMVGFNGNYGPCSGSFTSSLAVLNSNDCQTVGGNMQSGPGVSSDWKQWRLCGGNATNFYVMTGLGANSNSDGSWTYNSITCCRVVKK
nr:uncharacterized protein LOC128697377 [Cherax quadricarinatus]